MPTKSEHYMIELNKCFLITSNGYVFFTITIDFFLMKMYYTFLTLDLGESVHQRSVERSLFDRQTAVRAAEQAVWDQAEIEKTEALKRLQIKIGADNEKHLKRIMKQHKEALKVSD